jgi:hypothetical protein
MAASTADDNLLLHIRIRAPTICITNGFNATGKRELLLENDCEFVGVGRSMKLRWGQQWFLGFS